MKRFLWLVSLLMIPVLCALIVLNAFQVSKNLGRTGEIAAQRQRAADSQGAVKDLAFDLQAMETSQRGYLVTGDASYLKTYNEANGRLASRFPELQSRLAASDRPAEARVESLAAAKIEEMNQTIALRQKGYRHRAFLIEESGSGQQLMAEARKSLDTLAAGQAATVARYDRELQDILGKAARQSALANVLLLAIAAGAFFIFHRYRRRLEIEHRQQAEQLRGARGQVEHLTSIIFEEFGVRLTEMESDAGLLLDTYGGYLPRQAHERVERIRAGTGEMISMVGDLSKSVPPAAPIRSAPVQEVQSRSA